MRLDLISFPPLILSYKIKPAGPPPSLKTALPSHCWASGCLALLRSYSEGSGARWVLFLRK